MQHVRAQRQIHEARPGGFRFGHTGKRRKQRHKIGRDISRATTREFRGQKRRIGCHVTMGSIARRGEFNTRRDVIRQIGHDRTQSLSHLPLITGEKAICGGHLCIGHEGVAFLTWFLLPVSTQHGEFRQPSMFIHRKTIGHSCYIIRHDAASTSLVCGLRLLAPAIGQKARIFG